MVSMHERRWSARAGLAWAVFLVVALGSCGKSDDDGSPGGGSGGGAGVTGDLRLTARVSSSPPANVSLLIEATDQAGNAVANLLANGEIELRENGQRVSPFESRQRIQPIGRQVAFPTLLLLDLSGSIVRSGNLPQLKESAKQFVATLLDAGSANADAREIAVAFFPGTSNGRGIRLVSDFATDIAAIHARIDAIRGAPDTTTNLNEAILRGFEQLDARKGTLLQTTDVEFTEGSLVVFTDGSDRAGTVSTQDVLTAINATENRVFTIGLQGEIDEPILRQFGKTGFVLVEAIGNLQQRFSEVAGQIRAAANRFYAVEYCSPKRSGQHELTVIARIQRSVGSTTVPFDANAFRAGCRVPEGALELEGASDAELHAVAHEPVSGGFVVAGSIRGNAAWFQRGRDATGGSDPFLSVVVPPVDDGSPATEAWTRVWSTTGDGAIRAVVTDAAGVTYACGEFVGTLTTGAVTLTGNGQEPTGFVIALSPTGDTLWARAATGGGASPALALARTADRLLVAGWFTGDLNLTGASISSGGGQDAWLARLDPATGAPAAITTAGGPGDQRATAVAIDAAGTVAIAGVFVDRASFGARSLSANGTDGFVWATAADGTARFAVGFGGDLIEEVTALRVDLDGQFALTGSFERPFTLGGTRIEPVAGLRTGLLLLLGANDGGLLRHRTFGDASGGYSTRATALGEDGIGNLYVAWAQSPTASQTGAVIGFAMVVPSGERLLDYFYATDVAGTPRIAIGPLGLDQGVFTGAFRRAGSFGPFPLRFADPADPTAPLGGVNAFAGFLGPRS